MTTTLSEHDEPRAPSVLCGEHGFAHAHCMVVVDGCRGGYRCYCPTCEDLDEGDEYGFATNTEGHGSSPLEAAIDYADNYGGLDELTIREEHV